MDALPPSLDALVNPVVVESRAGDVPRMREQMLRDAACSLGIRGGLANRSTGILKFLDEGGVILDRFTFQPFMSSEGMLPPVVVEEIDATRQEGSYNKRSASVIYRMIKDAQFVMVAPTWRNYLYSGLSSSLKVEMPHKALMPSNSAEQAVWKSEVTRCWNMGIAQADAIFDENMSRFERDYLGMARYKMLVGRGMAENIKVGKDIREVTGSRTELIVDDQRYRITDPGGLVSDRTKWK